MENAHTTQTDLDRLVADLVIMSQEQEEIVARTQSIRNRLFGDRPADDNDSNKVAVAPAGHIAKANALLSYLQGLYEKTKATLDEIERAI